MNFINVGYYSTNNYAIDTGGKYILIDVGMPSTKQKLIHSLNNAGIDINNISHIICTHFHPDHCGIVQDLQEIGIQLIISSIQVSFIKNSNRSLKKFPKFKEIVVDSRNIMPENDRYIFFDRLGLHGCLIYTPGHSEDSISIVVEGLGVFTGDLPLPDYSTLDKKEIVKKSWDSVQSTGEKRIFPAHGVNFEL